MIIRPLGADEREAAARLLAFCLHETFKDLIPPPALAVLSVERMRRQLYQSAEATTLVATVDGVMVGLGQADGALISFLISRKATRARGSARR